MSRPIRRLIGRRQFLVGGGVAVAVAAGGALAWTGRRPAHAYTLAPESVLAPDILLAPPDVREAYRFALANRDVLRYIPCFCGCGADGHTSNASCYLKDDSAPDHPVFDRMSLG